MSKYYIAKWVPSNEDPNWKEVTLEEFQQAERNAGFRNKGGGPTATAAFLGGDMMGRVMYDGSKPFDQIAELVRHNF